MPSSKTETREHFKYNIINRFSFSLHFYTKFFYSNSNYNKITNIVSIKSLQSKCCNWIVLIELSQSNHCIRAIQTNCLSLKIANELSQTNCLSLKIAIELSQTSCLKRIVSNELPQSNCLKRIVANELFQSNCLKQIVSIELS